MIYFDCKLIHHAFRVSDTEAGDARDSEILPQDFNESKILIVEDECLLALTLKMNLSEAGYVLCDPVVSGEEAIERTKIEDPDVVLMDVHLVGELDGIEAARRIREFSDAQIIFVSGYPENSLKTKAMELNPAAYLIKPIEAFQVDSVLNSIYNP